MNEKNQKVTQGTTFLKNPPSFGAELDVHLMADGNLAVVHDSDLTRVCGKKGVIEDLRREDLKNYPLQGTGETIPLFGDVLDLFAGKTPLIVELKAERGNAYCRPEGGHRVFGASRPGVVEAPVGEPGGLEGFPTGVVSPGEEGN